MGGAADELHLTHGAVSRHVRNLENLLGQALFERGGRTLVPTAVAVSLAADVARISVDLDRSLGAARADAPAHSLTLSCEPTLLMRWLIPRIAALQVEHAPRLSMVAAGGPVPFQRDGIDLAIRRNDFTPGPAISTEPLVFERVGPVCTPAVAGSLRDPADLASHNLLHTRTRADAWPSWLRAQGLVLDRPASQAFEHFYIALEAATAGLGIAIASRLMVVDAINSGALVAPFGFLGDGSQYLLLSPRPFDELPELTAVRDFLTRRARIDMDEPEL